MTNDHLFGDLGFRGHESTTTILETVVSIMSWTGAREFRSRVSAGLDRSGAAAGAAGAGVGLPGHFVVEYNDAVRHLYRSVSCGELTSERLQATGARPYWNGSRCDSSCAGEHSLHPGADVEQFTFGLFSRQAIRQDGGGDRSSDRSLSSKPGILQGPGRGPLEDAAIPQRTRIWNLLRKYSPDAEDRVSNTDTRVHSSVAGEYFKYSSRSFCALGIAASSSGPRRPWLVFRVSRKGFNQKIVTATRLFNCLPHK